MDIHRLEEALHVLGELLEDRGLEYEITLIGGGALLLRGLVSRPTEDLDAAEASRLGEPIDLQHGFPEELARAIEEVGRTLDLPTEAEHGKAWLNPAPWRPLRYTGLPPGFHERLEALRHGALVVHVASRLDLLHLKMWAALDSRRRRSEIDLQDLRAMSPSTEELLQAGRWCRKLDGRPDFVEHDLVPLLEKLGLEVGVEDV